MCTLFSTMSLYLFWPHVFNANSVVDTGNDFQDNIKSAFGNLREDNDFTDVTLACEDGQQVEAHKVILVASSPFFQKLLGRNKHPHPLIYMRGMKSEDILAIYIWIVFLLLLKNSN